MAVVLYSPALAVQQVTGIPLWVSIFVTGFVCTIYTSFGGIKAVVFTDTFQVFVMFAGDTKVLTRFFFV
jgi:Na+/proline symporter